MKIKLLPLLLVFASLTCFAALRSDPVCLDPVQTPAAKPCAANAKSVILGDTLYIDGEINGMTYDLLSWGNAGQVVKHVELNSYGGDEDQGEMLAEIIRTRGMTTNVREGGFCASTCILLMQAGVTRTAHPTAKFGVHGVRIGGMVYIRKFYDACGDNGSQEKCDVFTALWYRESLDATNEMFGLMVKYGASPQLLPDYMRQGNDPDYYRRGNGLRVRDWVLDVEQARKYGLVN